MFSKFLSVCLLTVTGFLAAQASGETVTCSFYSTKYNGHRTASGQIFSSNALTAAHKTLPMGTRVKLTNPRNHHSVIVRVNDRGPFVKGRDISVTRHAAKRLGFTHAGVARLEMETLK
jgi:rare lipoprotein A